MNAYWVNSTKFSKQNFNGVSHCKYSINIINIAKTVRNAKNRQLFEFEFKFFEITVFQESKRIFHIFNIKSNEILKKILHRLKMTPFVSMQMVCFGIHVKLHKNPALNGAGSSLMFKERPCESICEPILICCCWTNCQQVSMWVKAWYRLWWYRMSWRDISRHRTCDIHPFYFRFNKMCLLSS